MGQLKGTSVSERLEDSTVSWFFEAWLADRILLSENKPLETTHTQIMRVLKNKACMEPYVAPSWMSG